MMTVLNLSTMKNMKGMKSMKRDFGELSSSPTTGLLEINFNVERLAEGLSRFVL
jgi:hypothetical protein